ncbi:SNARE associated protein [Desulfovibrio sp. X2]|uniref:TVP38/TMEM64 family protein n=1 Tax=Desulfovibrio sp. X2 TaxID=941449 RepID=UPI000358A1EA|nr:VTT domain-containing protein [Desulfovibrio sp. X2]EPR39858.1 SNARE associated protein [Desulfovibrio sp. X2]
MATPPRPDRPDEVGTSGAPGASAPRDDADAASAASENADAAPDREDIPAASSRRRVRAILKGLLLIVSLAAIGFAMHAAKLNQNLDRNALAASLEGMGALGWLLFVLGSALVSVLGMPRQLPAFLGGYVYGVGMGTLLSCLGAALGSTFIFAYARFFGRGFAARRFGRRIASFDRFLGKNPFAMSMVLRLLPVGNNLVTSLLAGLTSIPLLPFLAGSLIGYVPQNLVFALVGKGVRVAPAVRITIAAVLFVASTLWGFWLYRRYRVDKVLPDDGTTGD